MEEEGISIGASFNNNGAFNAPSQKRETGWVDDAIACERLRWEPYFTLR